MSEYMGDSARDQPAEKSAIGSIKGRKVYIRTFGCTYNWGDSRKLGEILKHQGCTLVNSPDEAEVVIVNTCTVVGSTERKVLRELRSLRHHPLYVTGCMAVVQKDAILPACNPVLIHPEEIQSAYRGLGSIPPDTCGIVQACHGCRGSCSYCITRLARGPLMSAGREEILREVRALAGSGVVEIQLTGQDVSAWGMDAGSDLGALLREIHQVPGHFMVRVGMMNPATLHPVLDSVAGAFLGSRVFSMLHLPVQSGSDAVLERMNRGYTTDQVMSIVRRFRELSPEISLHTDIICGYPGETEEDFQETLALLTCMQPDKVNVTRYSPRPMTPAGREKDMPDRFKKERSRILRLHSEVIARARNAAWISRVVPVLITEHPRPGSSMGRTPHYQGVVVMGDLPPGTARKVRLIEDRTYYFVGEVV
ncbi:MAG: MiaB/RimO family radical SAM methylthiotransferase [Methanolinea sp.]|nr:MiaB/RimO family radical SAM methylthiotransferase [Methanolinea sp.]